MSILVSIREYFVKMHLSFSLSLVECCKPSRFREGANFVAILVAFRYFGPKPYPKVM